MEDLSPTADAPLSATPLPAAAGASKLDEAWDGVISAWLAAQVANSPIARSTDAFNHLVAIALPALRQALQEIV